MVLPTAGRCIFTKSHRVYTAAQRQGGGATPSSEGTAVHWRRLPKTFCRVIAVLLAAVGMAGAQGGPPLLTDDPGTPGNRHWEINTGFTFEHNHDGSVFEVPRLDFNYGLGEQIQLKYELPWTVIKVPPQAVRGGPGNSLVGVKWRFLDQAKHGLAISAYPQFEFNNGTSSSRRGIVSEGTTLVLPLESSRQWGATALNVEFGWEFHQHEVDEWFYGIVAQRKWGRMEWLGELHGAARNYAAGGEVLLDAGGRWHWSEKFSLLYMVGRSARSFPGEPATLFGYIGVQRQF